MSTKEELSNIQNEDYEIYQKYDKLFFDSDASPEAKREALRACQQSKMKVAVLAEQVKPPSVLKQVWFPGVHINSGGGSLDSLDGKGDMEGNVFSDTILASTY